MNEIIIHRYRNRPSCSSDFNALIKLKICMRFLCNLKPSEDDLEIIFIAVFNYWQHFFFYLPSFTQCRRAYSFQHHKNLYSDNNWALFMECNELWMQYCMHNKPPKQKGNLIYVKKANYNHRSVSSCVIMCSCSYLESNFLPSVKVPV